MQSRFLKLSLSLLVAGSFEAVMAADQGPVVGAAKSSPAADSGSLIPGQPKAALPGPGVTEPLPPTSASSLLAQAVALYKTSPGPSTLSEVLRSFKTVLSDPAGQKAPAQSIIKANPCLGDLGVRALESGAGRIWFFPRIALSREIIVQWTDTRSEVTFVGRRHRKKITSVAVGKIQSLYLPVSVRLKEAKVVAGKDGPRVLILCGESNGTSLWLAAYEQSGGLWRESPDYFDCLPSFLRNDVSGRVSFRGADLLFMVARVVPAAKAGLAVSGGNLPESDSSTYKFWLRLTDSGYVLESHVADEEPYRVVYQFLQAFQQAKSDLARSYLVDGKLLSIPKYLGLRIPQTPYRVAEMSSPWSGGYRFRLVTFLKNDLIFDVGKVKDKVLIKGIFIAPADQFLQEIAKNLPLFDKISEPPPAKNPEEAVAPRH